MVPSGVLQWSVLGLLLVDIFVNEFPSVFRSKSLLFADDLMQVFRRCKSNATAFGRGLCMVNQNALPINAGEFLVISIPREPPVKIYTIDGTLLMVANIFKDLVQNNLDISRHCVKVVKSGMRKIFVCR